MFTVNLDSYAEDVKALALGITDANDGGGGAPRVHRKASTKIAEVQLIAGGTSIVVMIEESGLYVKGFRNGNGRFYFKDANNGSNELRFNCSYSDPSGIGIFAGGGDKEAKEHQNRATIEKALAALAAFRGGNDLHLKVPMALLAFILSEAIRFTYVYYRVGEVCGSANAQFTFADYKVYVQNWSAMSRGEVPHGAVPNKVYTAHN